MLVPPRVDKGSGIVISSDPKENVIRCGQDYIYNSKTFDEVTIVQIQCPLLNGAFTSLTAYKDGVKIDGFTGTLQFGPAPLTADHISGTYRFVAENNCGRDVAVTRISHKGLCTSIVCETFDRYESICMQRQELVRSPRIAVPVI